VTVGAFDVTLNPVGSIPLPAGVATVTNLEPIKALLAMTIFAVILESLTKLKLVTSIPPPNDIAFTPVKPVPVIVTLKVCPWLPELGLTPVTVGLTCVGGVVTEVVVIAVLRVVVVVGVVDVVVVVLVGGVAVVVVLDESAAITGTADIANTDKTVTDRIPIKNLWGSLDIILLSPSYYIY
jgi:hypothetical protein